MLIKVPGTYGWVIFHDVYYVKIDRIRLPEYSMKLLGRRVFTNFFEQSPPHWLVATFLWKNLSNLAHHFLQ